MPLLTISKTYANGNILTATDLDNAFNSIATLLNTTLLDSLNVQAGGLLGTNLANGTIGNAQLGVGSVGNAQIASSAITGDKLSPSITFPSLFIGTGSSSTQLTYNPQQGALLISSTGLQLGNVNNPFLALAGDNLTLTVSSSAGVTKPIVVSANPSLHGLMIVRGVFNGSTLATLAGEGFSVVRAGGPGLYQITFTNSFSDIPATTVTTSNGGGIANVVSPTTSSNFNISMSTSADPIQVSFVAMGQRA